MKCVRCRRCFFFREPSSGEPPGSEAEAFSESGGQKEAGHRALGPVRGLWFGDLGEFLSPRLAPTQVVTLDPTPDRSYTVFSSTPRRGRAHHCAPAPCSHVLEAEGVECLHLTMTAQGFEPLPHQAAQTPWREGSSREKRRHMSGYRGKNQGLMDTLTWCVPGFLVLKRQKQEDSPWFDLHPTV